MPSIAQYEAPPSDTQFRPDMEGIGSLERATEQQRQIAWKTAQLGHQTGQSIKEGIDELGRGVSVYEKAAHKNDEVNQKIASLKSGSDLEFNLHKDMQQASTQNLDDPNYLNKKLDEQRQAYESYLGTITNPKAKLQATERYTTWLKSEHAHVTEMTAQRQDAAFRNAIDTKFKNESDMISDNPEKGLRYIQNAPAVMKDLTNDWVGRGGISVEMAAKAGNELGTKWAGALTETMMRTMATKDPEGYKRHLDNGDFDQVMKNLPQELQVEAKTEWYDKGVAHRQGVNNAQRAQNNQVIEDRTTAFTQDKWQQVLQNGGKPTPQLLEEIDKAGKLGVDYNHPEASRGIPSKDAAELTEAINRYANRGSEWKPNHDKEHETIHKIDEDPASVTESEIRNGVGVYWDINMAKYMSELKVATKNNPRLGEVKKDLEGFMDNKMQITYDQLGHMNLQEDGVKDAQNYLRAFVNREVGKMLDKGIQVRQIEEQIENPNSDWRKGVFNPKFNAIMDQINTPEHKITKVYDFDKGETVDSTTGKPSDNKPMPPAEKGKVRPEMLKKLDEHFGVTGGGRN